MITAPIKTPDWFNVPSGFQYLRRTVDAIQLVYESGLLTIECSQPSFVLRDLLLGGVTHLELGIRDGGSLFENEINSAAFSSDIKINSGSGVILADNFPPKEGCFIIESEAWAAYHPFESLQVIGVKGSRVYIMTRTQVYQVECNDDSGRNIFKQLCGFATTAISFHLTQQPAAEFWSHALSRLFVLEIREVKVLPCTLGGMDDFLDLRKPAEQAVSVDKKIPAPNIRRGDIDI